MKPIKLLSLAVIALFAVVAFAGPPGATGNMKFKVPTLSKSPAFSAPVMSTVNGTVLHRRS